MDEEKKKLTPESEWEDVPLKAEKSEWEEVSPKAKEEFRPGQKKIMRTIPPLTPAQELAPPDVESPEYKKAATLTPEEEARASKGRRTVYPIMGATAGGLIDNPAVGWAAGGQAADLTDIAKGRPTEKSYTQQVAEMAGANLPQEGVGGKVVEQALKVPEDIAIGKALEVGGKYALKGAGAVAERIPYLRDLPWIKGLESVPGTKQTEARKVLESVKKPYAKEAGTVAPEGKVVTGAKPPTTEVRPSPATEKLPGKLPTAEEAFGSEKAPSPRAKLSPRKGAETQMKELKDIEDEVYGKARAATDKDIIEGAKKVNFDSTTEGLNKFEENKAFGRLHPPEKAQVRGTIRQIRREISPGARTGKTSIGSEQMEDIIETGTGEFVEGAGEVRVPGTFEQARATRSWLSEESANAFDKGEKNFDKGQKNLGIAYRKLKEMLEKDLEKAVGKDAWAAWKEADAFKTQSSIMEEIFGPKSEVRPGTYDPKKIESNIKKVDRRRLQANFEPDQIKVIDHLGDPGWVAAFQKTHPTISSFIRHLIYWGWVYPTAYAVGGGILKK